jgi:hypothetical protein
LSGHPQEEEMSAKHKKWHHFVKTHSPKRTCGLDPICFTVELGTGNFGYYRPASHVLPTKQNNHSHTQEKIEGETRIRIIGYIERAEM